MHGLSGAGAEENSKDNPRKKMKTARPPGGNFQTLVGVMFTD
jgi:hypothetical protein